MSKSNMSKQTKRQMSKPKMSREAAERRTAENKARRMMRQLKRSHGRDGQTAEAVLDLMDKRPHVRNVKV